MSYMKELLQKKYVLTSTQELTADTLVGVRVQKTEPRLIVLGNDR